MNTTAQPLPQAALLQSPFARPRGLRLMMLMQLLLVSLVLCLSACKPERAAALVAAQNDSPTALNARIGTAVSMRGYNFTAEGVQDFYVNDSWVSNLPPYGGGGATTCCAMLPVWYEGLSVTVDWTMGTWTVPYEKRKHLSISEQISCCSSERTLKQTVPVQRYDRADTLQVFFLPDDKLEVWVYDAGPQNPGHPSKRAYPVNPNPPKPGSTDLP